MLRGSQLQIKYRRINSPGFIRGRGRYLSTRDHSHGKAHRGDHLSPESEQSPGIIESKVEPMTADSIGILEQENNTEEKKIKSPDSVKQSPTVPYDHPAENPVENYKPTTTTSLNEDTPAPAPSYPTVTPTPDHEAVTSSTEASVDATQLPTPAETNPAGAEHIWMGMPQPKPSYYPYYHATWTPPYHQQWAIPYPVYPPPMFPMQPYSQTYWVSLTIQTRTSC
jgi:hypothetical protein